MLTNSRPGSNASDLAGRKSFRSAAGKATCVAAALAISTIASTAATAASDPRNEEYFFGMAPLSHDELGGFRGGFSIGGFDFDFGVVTHAAVFDGENPAGPAFTMMTAFTINGAGNLEHLGTTFTGHDAAGVNAVSSPETGTFSIGDAQSQVIQNIADSHIAAVLQNVGDHRSIDVKTEMNVSISNFTSTVRSFSAASMGRRIARDVTLNTVR